MAQKRRFVLIGLASVLSLAGCLADDDDEGTDTDDDGDDGDDRMATADDDSDDDAGNGDVTVEVGHGGGFVFDPDSIEIDVGETVQFVWEAGGHNIIVTEQPDGSNWEGVERTQSQGYSHSHTFDVEGRYEYICGPHEGQGMEGEVLVGTVEAPADDDDGVPAGGGGY